MDDKEKEHYMWLGEHRGLHKFNWVDFLRGLSIGLSAGYLIFKYLY